VRPRGAEIDLVATLHVPDRRTPVPGILLLHGSTPVGRKLGLYRVLADELCARGYAVLVPDQRGYGESTDPPRLDRAAAFDYVGDARRALDYLAGVDGVDASRLHVIGHSFGADVALSVGLAEPRVLKIVAFAPARGLIERAGTANAPQTGYYVRREMRYMELPSSIAREVFFAYRLPLLLDAHLDALSRPGHKPLLLIEGDREPSEQRDCLARLYERIAEPKAHVTLHRADHYANVADLGPFTVYSRRTMNELMDAIDGFLSPSSL
jgi:pimeloyl-ACP methyl ester carboxylesterase